MTRAVITALHIVHVTVTLPAMVKLQALLVAAVMRAVMRRVHAQEKDTKQIWNRIARTNRRNF